MKNVFKFLILSLLVSCGLAKEKDGEKCVNPIVNETVEMLSNYNKAFYGEDYSGTVIDYYDEQETKLKIVLHYEKGEIIKYESFYENGDPKIYMPIKCNSIHGTQIVYMNNSRKGYELEHKYGRKHGYGKSYFENGKVQVLVHFKDDLKHGKHIEFSESGDTVFVENYKNGVKIY